MKENKEKAVTSGDEDVQVQDTTTPVVQKPSSQTGKRKTISSSVNLDDLQVVEVLRSQNLAKILQRFPSLPPRW